MQRHPTQSVAMAVVGAALVVISGLALRISRQRDDLGRLNSALTVKEAKAQESAHLARKRGEEAQANAKEAQASAEEAQQRAADVLLLSLGQDYQDLVAEAEGLWPLHSEQIEGLQAWIAKAMALTDRLPLLIEKRDALRARALPQSEPEHAAERRSHPDFPQLAQRALDRAEEEEARTRARWWHNQVSGLKEKLESLEDPETGLVFVLLRGGKFWMGAQNTNPKGRNFDQDAGGDESPVHEVELSGFFLSKYEMTQGQWERLGGENPSIGPRRRTIHGLKGLIPWSR